MEDIFISHIHINEVHHLKNIDIPLSEDKRQHLILTGKNGSGKTSVLEKLKFNFEERLMANSSSTHFLDIPLWKTKITNLEENINTLKESKIGKNEAEILIINDLISERQKLLDKTKTKIRQFGQLQLKLKSISDIRGTLNFQRDFNTIRNGYINGEFTIVYFDAKRTVSMNKPTGVNKIQLDKIYTFSDKANVDFIQHIVNLKADRSFANDDNDIQTISDIDNWFIQFENSLKLIFNEQNLKLRFDRKKYNFDIVLNGHDAFDFTTLSDGYSAVLSIVTEIMMRMENKSSRNYNIQGIVFIDEIETHLHIDLQKKILPFLTIFFPKIQFIVTTHSPFVLTSVDNAVIFDLEKQIKLENLSGYSSEAIVESYFESDKYSDLLKTQIKRYEMLLNKPNPTFDEEEEIDALQGYFEELPKFLAPELQLTINQLELAHLN